MFDPDPVDPTVADRTAAAVHRLTLDLSAALINDHQHGLHEDHYDDVRGCEYPGCEDAFAFVDREQEGTNR